jgi:DNA polymerase-3 subunit epsilon
MDAPTLFDELEVEPPRPTRRARARTEPMSDDEAAALDDELERGEPLTIPTGPGVQRSFDDLGRPLHEVPFVVIDFETTGGSPRDCMITEVGAVKLQGGRCLGTMQTLVNPGQAVPPEITMITGITEAMVLPAPRIESVLPTLLEFMGDAVVVGHNVRFDLAFLNAACERAGYARRAGPSVDTCALARRLVRDEVPNCRLGTLARRFRLGHTPNHRALDDALATGDLLHVLLERAAGLGVMGLDDLLTLPQMGGHEQASKLRMTTSLPRAPGVYAFRDRSGRVLYVGKATNLRSRVRSYFSSDTRRKVGQLLRETHRIDHAVCSSPLEAAVREIRLIHRHQPRFNRQSKTWDRYAYVKLTLHESFPRLTVVRQPKDDGAHYLGPLTSSAAAKLVVEAVESVVPLRRCTQRIGARFAPRDSPCAPAQLGVATCPCAATISESAYTELVARTVRGLTKEPEVLLAPLRHRMSALAAAERFEEAADVRDRARALAQALRRQRRLDAVRDAGRLVITFGGSGGATFDGGRLVQAWAGDQLPLDLGLEPARDADRRRDGSRGDGGGAATEAPLEVVTSSDGPTTVQGRLHLSTHPEVVAPDVMPVDRERADELLCVASWLEHRAAAVRIVHCDGGLSEPLRRIATFEPIHRRERPP